MFDRIIGPKVHNLTPDQAYNAFLAFTCAEKGAVRDKITSVLLKKMSEVESISTYSNEQLIRWCEVLLHGNDKGHMVIQGLDIDQHMMSVGAGSYSYSELLLAT